MFTPEEKMNAIKLLPKYEDSYTDVILALGYPSRSSLINWHKEFLKTGHFNSNRKRKQTFSLEDKERVITHYLESGRNLSRTVRMLGYPSRETLRKWLLEYSPPIHTTKKRVEWSVDEKKEAVIQFISKTDSANALAEKINVSRYSLYKWKNEFLGKNGPSSMEKRKSLTDSETTELKEQIKELQLDVYRLQMEKDILEKASEIIKKDQGISLNCLTNKEKTQLIDALRFEYPLSVLLKRLAIAKSSYSYQHKVSNLTDKYADIRSLMKKIFEENYLCYGYRRMYQALIDSGISISEKVVRRLMNEEQLFVKKTNKSTYSSYEGEISPEVANIINRDFSADKPNEKWLTDITEFKIPAGKIYLSPIVDCFDGFITSWAISTSPNAALVNGMLDVAIESLSKGEAPIIHSDRGAHYRWPGWINRMNKTNLTRSMSKKGCSPDNSACEGFFGRIKNEFFYGRNWRNSSLESFIDQLDKYLEWYNEERIKMSLGGMSPMVYRQSLGISV